MALWKPIPLAAVAKRFEACDEGLVRTLPYQSESNRYGETFMRNMPGRILKPRINKQSPSLGKHPIVGIYIGNSRATTQNREIRVARLVCAAFYGLPYDPSDMRDVKRWRIRHIDGDITNCWAVNLEWVHAVNAATPEESTAAMTLYQQNVAKLEAQRSESSSAFLSRLFGTDEEENAA